MSIRKKSVQKHFVLFALCLLFPATFFSQFLNTTSYFDPNLPDKEPFPYHYGFTVPIHSDVLLASPSTYSPSMTNRYQMSLFGPRYKTTSGTNVTTYDFHQGEDFSGDFNSGGIAYTTNTAAILPDSSNLARIICMCDAVIESVTDGNDAAMELTESGRSITVKCDSLFRGHNPSWGNIYLRYYHLSKILTSPGSTVSKGDTIGVMGSTGFTSAIHLHLNVLRKQNNQFKHVHPMRIFNPTVMPHLHKMLQTASIEHLHSWSDSALFRISVPHNQLCVKRIKASYDTSFLKIFDFEAVSMDPNRDNYTLIPGISVLSYQLNRFQTQYARYAITAGAMPAFYPASPNRIPSAGFFPISNSFPYNTVAGSFDVILKGLPPGFNPALLLIEVSDIYGNVVSTGGSIVTSNSETGNENKIKIYPNPCSGKLLLEGARGATVHIINATGITVFRADLDSDKAHMDLHLASGIYSLKTISPRNTTVQRLIIDRND